jgi:hypothetical protein
LQAKHATELAAAKESAHGLLEEARRMQAATQDQAAEEVTNLKQQLDRVTANLHKEQAQSAQLDSQSKVLSPLEWL